MTKGNENSNDIWVLLRFDLVRTSLGIRMIKNQQDHSDWQIRCSLLLVHTFFLISVAKISLQKGLIGRLAYPHIILFTIQVYFKHTNSVH